RASRDRALARGSWSQWRVPQLSSGHRPGYSRFPAWRRRELIRRLSDLAGAERNPRRELGRERPCVPLPRLPFSTPEPTWRPTASVEMFSLEAMISEGDEARRQKGLTYKRSLPRGWCSLMRQTIQIFSLRECRIL